MKRAIAVLLLLGGIAQAQGPVQLALRGRINLPNVSGRIDHLSADIRRQRLFLAALGNHTLEVLDARNGNRLRTIANLAEPQGVLYDESSDRLFVACAADGTTKLFDAATFRLLDTVKFPGDADNIRHDARTHRVIVGYGDGALGLLDSNGKKMGEIPLDAHPESFQLEKAGTRVFVNVPNRKEIQVADLARESLLFRWSVTSASQNYPMALDEEHHRLLIGCRTPARLLVIDTGSGRQTASVEIVGDTDDLFYDAARSCVYVIGGEGFIDVLSQRDADHYARAGRLTTAPGARTGLFVPEWGKLFVAVPRRSEQPAQVLVYEAK